MYSTGLVKFLQAKKVRSNDAINSFLAAEGVLHFTARHHRQVDSYLQKNWTKFATFIDKEIRSGKLKGQAVKLNSYYDEQRERKEVVAREFLQADLSADQKRLLAYIKEYGEGSVQLFLIKKGITGLGKDHTYTSRKLQWLPLVNKALENEIDIDELYRNKLESNLISA